jgi:hypothetical protein
VNEFYTLLIVAWIVYLSETIWWVRERQVVVTGMAIGEFRAHYGPVWLIAREHGFFCPRIIPPFTFSFLIGVVTPSRPGTSKDRVRATEAARTAMRLAARPMGVGEAIWAYVFVGIPLAIVLFGFLRTWLVLLALLLVMIVGALAAYRFAWRALRPADPHGWRSHAWLMAVSPLGTIRAADHLTRDALADYAPIVAVTTLARPEDATRIARLAYFDCGGGQQATTFNRDEYTLLAPLMAADVFAPPERESSQMCGYCPRCHTQLTRPSGVCPDCHTIGIVRFATNG